MTEEHESSEAAEPAGDVRWWSERFWSVMESIGAAHRLERGKRYARAERVLSLEVEPGVVRSEIQGSRYEPYDVEIKIDEFTKDEWRLAVKALASQALFSAKLLSGEMPENIERTLSDAGLSLFPASSGELSMECSCPDSVVPCKHIAATHFVLADKLDADPFLLFRWRGLSRARLLHELRRQRAAEASGQDEAVPSDSSLEDQAHRFWKMGAGFDSLSFSVRPPAVTASLLKRLGAPPFWKPHPEIRGSLERLYAKVTERAMALAYSGQGIGRSDDDSD